MRTALETWGDAASLTPPEGIPVATPPPTRATVFRSWMLVPLLVVAVAAALIAGGIALGRLELGGPLGVRAAPPASGDVGGGGVTISIVSASDHDPFGDGSEHPADTDLAIDGKDQTAWFTDHYSTAKFGQLKPGLGLFLDLGKDTMVGRVTVTSPLRGWTFELIPGSEPNEEASPLASASGEVEFTIGPNGKATVDVSPQQIRGLMIWITSLAPDQGRFAAAVSEVSVRGPA